MISRGVEISIAGGGEEMVRAYLLVETKPLLYASSYNRNLGESSPLCNITSMTHSE